MNAASLLIAMGALGLGDSTYIPSSTIVISGLDDSAKVSLSNDVKSLFTGGNGQWSLGVAFGERYDVRVSSQPPGQICSITNGKGTVGTDDSVPIEVHCAGAFSVGGTIFGLSSGESIEIEESHHRLQIGSNGEFAFTHGLIRGKPYAVTINVQPDRKICEVSGASGSMPSADVSTVTIRCVVKRTESGGLPVSIYDDDLGTVPPQVARAAKDPEESAQCTLAGKRIALADSSRQLWFVIDTCGGSEGDPIFMVLVSAQGARIIGDFGLNESVTLESTSNQGLPDISVAHGSNCCGSSYYVSRFDGTSYKVVPDASSNR